MIAYLLPSGEIAVHRFGYGYVYYTDRIEAEADGYTDFEPVQILVD